jgi:hypothetical protein
LFFSSSLFKRLVYHIEEEIMQKREGESNGTGSVIVTDEVAKLAIALERPFITRLMDLGIAKRNHLHVVVLDPGVIIPVGVSFKFLDDIMDYEDLILHEESFGDKSQWEHPYDEYARSKAVVSLRTKLPSLYVVQSAPFLLVPGDTCFGGSAYLDGIAVGVSGVDSHIDQMIADRVAATIRGLAIDIMQFKLANNIEGGFFAI